MEQFSQNVLKNYSGVRYAYAQCDQVASDVSPFASFVQILNNLTKQAAKKSDNWFVEYMREVGPDILGMFLTDGSLLTSATKIVMIFTNRAELFESSLISMVRFLSAFNHSRADSGKA